MTRTEFLSQFKRMPPEEQRALFKAIQRMMEKPSRRRLSSMDFQPGRFIPAKDSSFYRVLGALRQPGKAAPNDEDIRDMIADTLIEKHS